MWEYNNTNELYHWGVKGQKWGFRRYQNKDGSLTAAGRKRQKKNLSQDAKDAYKLKKKKVGELSNAELKKLNERQNLERTYKQNNKTKIAAGLAAAGTAIAILNKIGSIEDSAGKLAKLADRGRQIAERFKK